MVRFCLIIFLSVFSFPAPAGDFSKGDFTDPRDGQVYPTVEIGGLTWFAKNLNYAFPGSYCYDDDQASCDQYGRLYRWEDSLAACPVGWHGSSDFEWMVLEAALGMAVEELAAINPRGTDQGDQLAIGGKTGFNYDLPGYRDPAGVYKSQGEAFAVWHTNESAFGTAWHRDLRPERSGIWRSRVNKEYALSVRCVKNMFDQDYEEWGF